MDLLNDRNGLYVIVLQLAFFHDGERKIRSAIWTASSPLNLTMAIAPSPIGVEMAAIVSKCTVLHLPDLVTHMWITYFGHDYLT